MRLIAIITGAFACLWSAASAADSANWPTASPEQHGFDSALLAEVISAADASTQPIHSVTVVRGDEVILDVGFYPYDPSTIHDMASVTKSVTTTLVGMAAAEGALDLDAPMLSFFADLTIANRDARKEAVTVRHLMQNLSGLACVGSPEEMTLADMEVSEDFIQFALDLPMRAQPGSRFDYCSPGMHILSAIIQRATGVTAAAYAQQKLFEPIGITDAYWESDPQGITRGWGDLHLKPADMIRLGMLWLHGGLWNERKLIPGDWLRTATTTAVKSDRYEDYGYGFWIGPESEPIPYFFASGRGGQRIVVAPAIDLVIAVTGGGIDPGAIIDPIVSTLLDPAGALPANAVGEKRLAAAVDAAAAPPPATRMLDLPVLAATLSGRTYIFDANPYGLNAIGFALADGDLSLTISDPTGTATRPVGLDGTYRWSVEPHGVRYGLSGYWSDAQTMVVDYNTIGDIRAYTITAHFVGDTVELTIEQRDEPTRVQLTGHAGSGG